jgi:hypothetical protein
MAKTETKSRMQLTKQNVDGIVTNMSATCRYDTFLLPIFDQMSLCRQQRITMSAIFFVGMKFPTILGVDRKKSETRNRIKR